MNQARGRRLGQKQDRPIKASNQTKLLRFSAAAALSSPSPLRSPSPSVTPTVRLRPRSKTPSPSDSKLGSLVFGPYLLGIVLVLSQNSIVLVESVITYLAMAENLKKVPKRGILKSSTSFEQKEREQQAG